METLKQKTARGLFWGGMNTMVQQVIGLLFGIILGRLLAPSDYGMMAIISVFSLVAVALQDSGFKVALANEKAPRTPTITRCSGSTSSWASRSTPPSSCPPPS